MADPVNYSGAQYEASYYKQPNETLSEYMMRLAQMRAKGILGGGGMLDVATPPAQKEVAAQPLGEVVVNQSSSDSGDGAQLPRASKQERYEGARWMLDNPAAAMLARGIIPFGLGSLLMSDRQLEGYVRNTQNEATGSQGFFDYLLGRDGDVVLGDRGTGSGSLVTGQASNITRDMFPERFDPSYFTKDAAAYPAQMPTLFEPARVIPQASQIDMTPLTTKNTYTATDTSTGTDYTVQSNGGWSAADTSSWDTSKEDGSKYDISSWFSD